MSSTVQISPELSPVPAPARPRVRAEAPEKSFADLVEPSDKRTTPNPAPGRNDQRTNDARSARPAQDGRDNSGSLQRADDDAAPDDERSEGDDAALPVATQIATLQQPTPTPAPVPATTPPSVEQPAAAIDAVAAPGSVPALPTDGPAPTTAQPAQATVPPPAVDPAVTTATPQPIPTVSGVATEPANAPTQAGTTTPAPAPESEPGDDVPSAEATTKADDGAATPAATPTGLQPTIPPAATGTDEAQTEAAVAIVAAPTAGTAPTTDKASAKATKSKLAEDAPKPAGNPDKPAAPASSATTPSTSAQAPVVPASTEAKADDGTAKDSDAPTQTGDAATAKTEAPRHPDAPRAEPQRNDAFRVDPPRLPDTAAARAAAQAPANAMGIQAPVALPHLAVTIASRARGGERQFEIRLDPADLGRIDVKMSIDENGTTTTRISVERSDTLDLMLRDSRSLERALTQAGFKTDDGALQFNLRSGGDDSAFRQQGSGFANDDARSQRFLIAGTESGVDGGSATPPPALGAALYGRGLPRLGGIDVSV